MATPKERAVQRCAPFYSPLFLFILLVLASYHNTYGQDPCVYEFQRQPPSSIDCNPYENTARLVVECRVLVPPASALSRFEIQWFHNDVLITEDSFTSLEDIVNDNTNRLVTSEITFHGRDPDDTVFRGNLYCQLAIDGNVTLTIPSSSLTLGTHNDHIGFDPCRTDIYSEASISCAGKISPPPLEPTSTNNPPTTEILPSIGTNDVLMTTPSPTPLVETGSTASPTSVTGPTLQVWVFVLVAIAAVFGMIIIVLAILCVGLCLKKNKTTDSSFKQGGTELKQFATDSMISNGIYQHKGGEDEAITSGTHKSSHTQISDYNTLGERDYEVIDVAGEGHQRDYHHLQRPSPPLVPNGRSATFQFSPTKEFHSMSTLTSQIGKGPSRSMMQHGMMDNMTYMEKSASVGPEDHVYRELEQQPNPSVRPRGGRGDIYRSPTDSTPPDSTPPDSARSFNRGGGAPHGHIEPYSPNNPNEYLYSPKGEEDTREHIFTQSGLGGVPETGSMFPESANPTSFPVHKYEKVPGEGDPQYETPIASRKNSACAAATMTTTTAPSSSSLMVAPQRARSRTDSGTQYETEVQQKPPQYHKLTRYPGGNGNGFEIAPASNSQLSGGDSSYSELINTRQRPQGNGSSFSRNITTNDREKQVDNTYNGGSSSSSYPTGTGMTGVPNPTAYSPPQSLASSVDSLTAYIDRLQTEDPIGVFINDDGAGMIKSAMVVNEEPVQRRTNGYRGSFVEERGSSMPPDMQRASWRGDNDALPERASRSSFSGEDYSHLFHNQERNQGGYGGQGGYVGCGVHEGHRVLSNGTKMNWLDSRGGEYVRSKTMV